MKKLKPVSAQVVVVLGAASGMGRATALKLAGLGARIVAAARDRPALDDLVQEITSMGGEALAFECDVADFQQVKALSEFAVAHFGRIDTWANFAATAVYAPFDELSPEEFRRVIEVNLLGQAYGAMVALPILKKQQGGALIFLSSVEGEISIPLTSAYAASKHGMNGFIDALRIELAHENSPVSVTTIMPTGVNTPFFSNARTKLGVKPKPPEPIYSPDHVAAAVAYAAEHPVRELFVGGAAKLMVSANRLMPRLVEYYLKKTAFKEQRTTEPKGTEAPSGMFEAQTGDKRIHGDFSQRERHRSFYLWFQMHPLAALCLKGAAFLAAGATVGHELRRQRSWSHRPLAFRSR